MRKLLSLILSLLCAMSLVSCTEQAQEQTWDVGNTTAPDLSTQIPGGGVYTVTAGYDYGMHHPGLATMLYDSSTLFFTLPEGFDPPVAGDEFTVTYTGELIVLTTYPSTVMFKDGAIVSVSAQKAEMRRVTYYPPSNGSPERFVQENDNGTEEELRILSRPDYYITSGKGDYKSLSDAGYGITLFLTYSPIDGRTDEGITVSGLYAWNPRYTDRAIDTDTLSAIQELMQNVSLPFVLLTKQEDCDLAGYTHEPGFGCDRYTKDGVSLTFSHYPDEANEAYLLTDLTVSGVGTIFGGGAEKDANEIANRLEDNGYTVEGFEFPVRAERYGVHLTVSEDNGVLTLRAVVYATNDTGIIY